MWLNSTVILLSSPPAQWRMNGLSLSELCCLFCCPPCPSRIAAKLAFLPPEPTYTFLPDPEAGPPTPAASSGLRARSGASVSGSGAVEGRWKLLLTERAEFQYTQRELDMMEVFLARSSRGNRVGCMYIRCIPNARWVGGKILGGNRLTAKATAAFMEWNMLDLLWPVLRACHTSSEAFPLPPVLSVFFLSRPGRLPSLVRLLTQLSRASSLPAFTRTAAIYLNSFCHPSDVIRVRFEGKRMLSFGCFE